MRSCYLRYVRAIRTLGAMQSTVRGTDRAHNAVEPDATSGAATI